MNKKLEHYLEESINYNDVIESLKYENNKSLDLILAK